MSRLAFSKWFHLKSSPSTLNPSLAISNFSHLNIKPSPSLSCSHYQPTTLILKEQLIIYKRKYATGYIQTNSKVKTNLPYLMIPNSLHSKTTEPTSNEVDQPSLTPSMKAKDLGTHRIHDDVDNLWSHLAFDQLNLNPALLDALSQLSFYKPTSIQGMVIPEILSQQHHHLIFADQTGSGKTLAYLLPILHLLKHRETIEEGPPTQPHRPKALILAPSQELSIQIGSVIKQLTHHIKLKSAVITRANPLCIQKKKLSETLDILTATPGTLMHHLDHGRLFLSKLMFLVVDEMDTMLTGDAGFSDDITRFMKNLQHRMKTNMANNQPLQIIYTGATITNELVMNKLSEIHEEMRFKMILSSRVHRLVPNLQQEWIEVAGRDKAQLLLDALSGHQDIKSIMIFCNTIASCRYVDHFLTEKNLHPACCHGDMPIALRKVQFAEYLRGERKILVCTDLASRGLDILNQPLVILFDFPLNAIDYVHRVGRTARAGHGGKVINLLKRRDMVLARSIQNTMDKRRTLAQITSSSETNAKFEEEWKALEQASNASKKMSR